jgi:hypothetical protein
MNLDSCFHRKPWIPAEVYPRESGGGNDENGAKRTFYEAINLNRQQTLELFYYLPEKYGVEIIPSPNIDSFLPETSLKDLMDIICKKASLGDALIANLLNNLTV